ncbi:unnamed protein product [Danaus chrysippus]|uniref:(African queen) hypothetical protein n=1 Tax=Danaus chrysippus TaxID=151541 RepID=A0A8J2R571_9NEOP|nr:unnamed protein product [Danaus chrysippus]
MPELIEQMYCSQQIVIPPKFPYILKRYCKAAIKTQPYDLLRWSYEYFTALSEHRPPPVKLRLEYPIYSTEGGLTRGCLKVLANQTLTHEPDGGSAAIPVQDFLMMYRFLAAMDASKDVKYLNGYREGETPKTESTMEEEEQVTLEVVSEPDTVSDEYWGETKQVQKLNLINDMVPQTTRLSLKLNMPALGKIERSPSMERAGQIERENYMRERKGRIIDLTDDISCHLNVVKNKQKLRQMSGEEIPAQDKKERKEEKTEKKKEGIEIILHDEEDNEIPYEIYGEQAAEEFAEEEESNMFGTEESKVTEEKNSETDRIKEFLDECEERRLERIADLEKTFEEIEIIVDKFKSANYDLGMVAGRQMSTTSGEFIVAQVEKDIMDYINEQIAILPDPDLKKKKAKPEEIAMIRELVENYLDENMEAIVPEVEEVEEEELPIPEVTVVHAVPGIGPTVDEDIVHELEYYLLDVCKVQADMVMPRNIRHFLCPPLEKYKEHDYDNLPSKEELATGGVITD